jgi:hypothetical protein
MFVRSCASRVLGVGPALVLLADQLVGRHLDVVEEHLVDLVLAIHRDDRPHGDAGALHVDQQEADAGLRLAFGAVRTRQKIQSPYWPSVVQVFWPLTM